MKYILVLSLFLVSACSNNVTNTAKSKNIVDSKVVTSKSKIKSVSKSKRDTDVKAEKVNKSNNYDSKMFTEAPTENIYFHKDSAEILPKYLDLLFYYAIYILQNDIKDVVVEGHTDERGDSDYNFRLGERRAYEVKKVLVYLGVPSYYIEIISYGEDRLISQIDTYGSINPNSRAVIVLK